MKKGIWYELDEDHYFRKKTSVRFFIIIDNTVYGFNYNSNDFVKFAEYAIATKILNDQLNLIWTKIGTSYISRAFMKYLFGYRRD